MDDTAFDLEQYKTVDQLQRALVAMKRENVAAMQTITKLLKDLNQKADEISHLKEMLTQNVPVIQPEKSKVKQHITPESEIAELQLQRLQQAARQRTLTLEETRMYDLLVKNKRLSMDESTINLSKSHYRDVTDTDLMQLVGKPKADDEPDNT